MGAGYHGGFGNTYGKIKFAAGDIELRSDPEFFFELASKRKEIDPGGMLDIVAHGAKRTIQIMINGEKKNVSARFLARMIKHSKQYKKNQPIRLVSCDTGRDDYGFAQQLANKLHVPVVAPTRKYLAMSNGSYIIADTKNVGGKNYIDFSTVGKMKTFNPGGVYKK